MILAGEHASGVFHLSDGGYHSWDEVGGATAAALGRELQTVRIPVWAVRLAGEIGEAVARVSGSMPVINHDKVRDIMQPFWICGTEHKSGFTPETDLMEGMQETVAWYQSEGWL